MTGELTAQRLHEVLARKLEEDIVQGRYAPGEQLPSARQLSRDYGVSMTVVRDAIRSLAGKGLVRVQQGVGTFVTEDAHASLVESFRWAFRGGQVTRSEVLELGRLMDAQIAALAAQRRSQEDLLQMQQALQRYGSLSAVAPLEEASICHSEFHSALMRAAHNRAFQAIAEPLLDVISESADPQRSAHSLRTGYPLHERILQCVESGDAESARRAMEQHYASG